MLWTLAVAALCTLPPTLPSAFFPLESITRGQRGTCYTVFEGDTVEPFDFEVKGVMKHFLGPKRDVVLVKLLGDRPTFTGVVAGMSGSPCVLQGKFLGALAYAFSVFAKEPIAGITPIDSMQELWRIPAEGLPTRLQTTARGQDSELSVASAAQLRPIATPLMLGGVPQSVQQEHTPWLQAHGFEPIAGAAHGSAPAGARAKTLVPGGSVSAVMIRGDVDIAATGTVTQVDHGRVLAFGHPFMGAGAVSFPMATADILNIMVSSMRSFKMSVTGPVVGEVTQDRLTAIGGVLGSHAKMIPVTGTVRTPTQSANFSLEVARDPVMSPRLVTMGLAAALVGRVDATQRGTVRSRATLSLPSPEGTKLLQLTQVYAAQRDASVLSAAATDVGHAFGALWEAPFGAPPEMAVHLEVDVDPNPIEEVVEGIYLDRPRLHPGEMLQVAVRLRQRDLGLHTAAEPTVTERFAVPVPRSWAGQTVQLLATAAPGAERLAGEIAGAPVPTDRADILRYLAGRRHNGQVFLLAVRKAPGLHFKVDDLSAVPPSVVATYADQPRSHATTQTLCYEARRDRPGVVHGAATTSVEVLPF
jgi:hypothetical protein